MKIGVVYPQNEYSLDAAAVRDYAQTAEGLGFTHILAFDHVLGASLDHPNASSMYFTVRDSFYEPLLMFGFMAGVTQRIEFATGVIILPQRQTALFAKQAATLDRLCEGRLRLGIGLGWNEIEYTALNENFHNRGKRMDEQIELLRLFWSKQSVTFKGRWHNIDRVGLNPLPDQRPIPLWIGGSSDAALRRAAKHGDGWMGSAEQADSLGPCLETLQSKLVEFSRKKDTFGVDIRIGYNKGDANQWEKQVEDLKEKGVTHISFSTMGAGLSSPEKHLQAISEFARVMGLSS